MTTVIPVKLLSINKAGFQTSMF